jgi:hypothetical protein
MDHCSSPIMFDMFTKTLLSALLLTLLVSCSTQPAATTNEAAPGGRWSGEYQVGEGRPEHVTVELKWEGENLRGTVYPGPRSLPLTKADYKPETGAISMEFDADGPGGRTVHYVADGKVSGNEMTGTWAHDDQKGDFKITKQ